MQVATNTTPLEYGLPSAFMEMATKPLLEREKRISLVRERPCQSGGGTNTEYHLPFIVHPTLRSLRCASEQRISSSETPTLGIPIKHSSRNESANSLKVTARRKSLNPDQTPLAQYTVHNVNTKRAGKRTESGLGMGVGCARLIRYRCCAPAVCGRQRSGRKKKTSLRRSPSCPLSFLFLIERSNPLSPDSFHHLQKRVRSVQHNRHWFCSSSTPFLPFPKNRHKKI